MQHIKPGLSPFATTTVTLDASRPSPFGFQGQTILYTFNAKPLPDASEQWSDDDGNSIWFCASELALTLFATDPANAAEIDRLTENRGEAERRRIRNKMWKRADQQPWKDRASQMVAMVEADDIGDDQ
jgi:hypothetical protein